MRQEYSDTSSGYEARIICQGGQEIIQTRLIEHTRPYLLLLNGIQSECYVFVDGGNFLVLASTRVVEQLGRNWRCLYEVIT
jgi:hypothetical protein